MSKRQTVFVILKPDCLKRGLEDKLIDMISSAGLLVLKKRTVVLTDNSISVIYEHLLERHFYDDLREFMRSGPSMALLISGLNAISVMNELKHRIRKEYFSEGWIELTDSDIAMWEDGTHPNQVVLNIKLVASNLLHVCDSVEESAKCTKLFF